MKKIEVTNTMWWGCLIVAVVIVGYVYGCTTAPTAPVQTQIDKQVQRGGYVPIKIDQYGSEIMVHLWMVGDSLSGTRPVIVSEDGWLRWLKCVNQRTTFCGDTYPNDSEKFWQCVALSAAGCAIGDAILQWPLMIFSI